jgi:hypothetical protein
MTILFGVRRVTGSVGRHVFSIGFTHCRSSSSVLASFFGFLLRHHPPTLPLRPRPPPPAHPRPRHRLTLTTQIINPNLTTALINLPPIEAPPPSPCTVHTAPGLRYRRLPSPPPPRLRLGQHEEKEEDFMGQAGVPWVARSSPCNQSHQHIISVYLDVVDSVGRAQSIRSPSQSIIGPSKPKPAQAPLL